MIRVKVPATSANLGVGFDCMGLALDWQGVFTFCFDGPEFMISGCPKTYQNKDNLVYHAFARTLMALGKRVPVVQIHIDTPIPVARGLGSSASCIVAGVLGAVAYSGQKLPLQELLRLATLLEHHPDNVAPALYGSLCASFMENGLPYTAQFAVHEKFRFVTIIPDYEVRTEDARRILPSDMSYADAIYQMGRCATLGKALESGDEEMVRHACIDRMQEPYRNRLIPEYDEVKRLCMDLGALAFVISGSGSTMLAVCTADTGGKLCRQLSERFRSWQVLELKAAAEGGAFEIHE